MVMRTIISACIIMLDFAGLNTFYLFCVWFLLTEKISLLMHIQQLQKRDDRVRILERDLTEVQHKLLETKTEVSCILFTFCFLAWCNELFDLHPSAIFSYRDGCLWHPVFLRNPHEFKLVDWLIHRLIDLLIDCWTCIHK